MNFTLYSTKNQIPHNKDVSVAQTIHQPPRTIIKQSTYPENNPQPVIKKMKWGEPFWFFFHTIAEKVKSEYFLVVRQDLLKHIYNICNNLPCPMCTEHAKEYLKNINFNTIQTKEDLKDMLYNFHNAVNVRKNVPLYPRSELDEKYSKANTGRIINHFLYFYQEKHNNVKIMADDMFRKRQAKIIIEWFQQNIQYFDM